MDIRWGAVALAALGAFAVMRLLDSRKKAQYVALTTVGLGAGGFVGATISNVTTWMANISSSTSAWALGSGASWVLALMVTLFYTLVMIPNRIEPAGSHGKKWIDYTMLAVSPLAIPSFMAALAGLGAIVGVV